jgi:hypothetical protein
VIIELVGGPHCGMRFSVTKVPPSWRQEHSTASGTWDAFYVPDGLRTQDGYRWRFTYTEQRPAQPPPVMPGHDGGHEIEGA